MINIKNLGNTEQRSNRAVVFLSFLCCSVALCFPIILRAQTQVPGPIVIIDISGTINPATDDFLKSSLAHAKDVNARLFVVQLNTPGGLLTSMQTMVESLLQSPIPTVVYVTPSGAGATSAGAFITMAAHFAVMAPGTTIGAAHPVSSGGQDVGDDMKAKVENFTASMIKAIAEQRGRNIEWAEKAVRESVSITDREAVQKKVVDFSAADLNSVLLQLEGKKLTIAGNEITLENLRTLPRETVPMTFRQKVVNVLSDPNIALIIGLGAMLGLGIELYHPGAIVPGVIGSICLILSLTAAQVLPINYGGALLLLLGAVFFIVELMAPSFGIWGFAGTICFVLGSIYVIDTDLVWGAEGFTVDKVMVGSLAAGVGAILLAISFVVFRDARRQVVTGSEGLLGKIGTAKSDFSSSNGHLIGKIQVMGELWNARVDQPATQRVVRGSKVRVVAIEEPLTLVVRAED